MINLTAAATMLDQHAGHHTWKNGDLYLDSVYWTPAMASALKALCPRVLIYLNCKEVKNRS